MANQRSITLDQLVAEYHEEGIGERIYDEVRAIVRAVVRSYDPEVYGHVASWDLGLEDLVQEFGQDVLVAQGQLDYAVLCSSDLTHFRRLLARQVRYLLARRRRRTIVDNLLDRARKRVASPPFRLLNHRSNWSYTLLDKDVSPGGVSEECSRAVAYALADVPIIRCEPRRRAPVVYGEKSLERILETAAREAPCAVGVNDLDLIFSLMLTSWVPTFLKNGEGVLARTAARGLDGEEQAMVKELSRMVYETWDEQHRDVLGYKLDGLSDREMAGSMAMSRPTVARIKREVFERLELELADLRPGLRRAVMDQLGEILNHERGSR